MLRAQSKFVTQSVEQCVREPVKNHNNKWLRILVAYTPRTRCWPPVHLGVRELAAPLQVFPCPAFKSGGKPPHSKSEQCYPLHAAINSFAVTLSNRPSNPFSVLARAAPNTAPASLSNLASSRSPCAGKSVSGILAS